MNEILTTCLFLVTLKAFFIGSDFAFPLWINHGSKYTDWYFNRPEFPEK